jgi:hypothetical protein
MGALPRDESGGAEDDGLSTREAPLEAWEDEGGAPSGLHGSLARPLRATQHSALTSQLGWVSALVHFGAVEAEHAPLR